MGDITYLPLAGGEFLYLATVPECFSRRVVGWSIADHMRTSLVADSLPMAASTRGGLPVPSAGRSRCPGIGPADRSPRNPGRRGPAPPRRGSPASAGTGGECADRRTHAVPSRGFARPCC
ncbi:DDE-type integrase/transposase/recombinase [Streptomyces scopuliridis]|uniref:DDE-type integrase/transposase/recombinase n=1 Tax=Streptomyces scopuliridis TaxID=452529 RepID=UPI003683E5AB